METGENGLSNGFEHELTGAANILLARPAVASLFARNLMLDSKRLKINHIARDFPIDDLQSLTWASAEKVVISKYWSGKKAPAGRQFTTRLLWSETHLYVRFDANQTEPLIVNQEPDMTRKTRSLWDRDVCEMFITPDKTDRNKYFEFEIAPTGEWIELEIQVAPEKRETDWDYSSKMTSSARIETDKVVMAIKIPWEALRKTPKPGDVWLGNLFRCVGHDPTRGYLAWQPTLTIEPSFHIPSAFGEFEFRK